MYKNALSLYAGKVEKLIMDPNPDQSKNLINWSLAEALSFHKIWFKSINNLDPYSQNLTECSLSEGLPLPKIS